MFTDFVGHIEVIASPVLLAVADADSWMNMNTDPLGIKHKKTSNCSSMLYKMP